MALLLVLICFATLFVGCKTDPATGPVDPGNIDSGLNGKDPDKDDPQTSDEEKIWKDFDGVCPDNGKVEERLMSDLSRPKKLYVVNYTVPGRAYNDLTCFSEIVALSVLQGFVARSEGATENLYLLVSGTRYDVYLDEMEQFDGVESAVLTEKPNQSIFEQAIRKFAPYVAKTASGKYGFIRYTQEFKDGVDWNGTPIRDGKECVNAACTVASATGYLAADSVLAEKLISWGFEEVLDVSNWTEERAFDAYKDQLSDRVINATPNYYDTNRDIGIATRSAFLDKAYVAISTGENFTLQKKLETKYKQGTTPVIMGWASFTETKQFALHSKFGFLFVCTNFGYNMSVHASMYQPELKQRAKESDITADPNKHYIALIMSDGDNLTWHDTSSVFSQNMWFDYSMNKELRSENPFKMGWTMGPMMVDLSAPILRYIYRKTSPYDYFVCSTSGIASTYSSMFEDATLQQVAKWTGEYMRRADMSYMELCDDKLFEEDVMEAYSSQESIKGAFFLQNSNKYIQGGDIKWRNDKPFLGIGEAMWEDTPERTAFRISSLQPDIHSINGYTAIKVHCWSTPMTEVAEMVKLLAPHIEVVTPGELMKLIVENVPHVDATRTQFPSTDYPSGM